MKFAILAAVSLATCMAQYGGVANDNSGNYGSNDNGNVYGAPANDNGNTYGQKYYQVYVDSDHYYEHRDRPKRCPNLRTYLPQAPEVSEDSFYPPIIRYIKHGRRVKALVVCDANPKTVNILLARRNSSRQVEDAYVVAIGTTAARVFTCDRDEERYLGNVISPTDTNDFTDNVAVTQVACMRLDRTSVGRESANTLSAFGDLVQNAKDMCANSASTTAAVRRKRQARPSAANTTTTASTPTTTTTTTTTTAETTTTNPATDGETTTTTESTPTTTTATTTGTSTSTASPATDEETTTTTASTPTTTTASTTGTSTSTASPATDEETTTTTESTSTTTTGATDTTTQESTGCQASTSENASIPEINLRESSNVNATVADAETGVAVVFDNFAAILRQVL